MGGRIELEKLTVIFQRIWPVLFSAPIELLRMQNTRHRRSLDYLSCTFVTFTCCVSIVFTVGLPRWALSDVKSNVFFAVGITTPLFMLDGVFHLDGGWSTSFFLIPFAVYAMGLLLKEIPEICSTARKVRERSSWSQQPVGWRKEVFDILFTSLYRGDLIGVTVMDSHGFAHSGVSGVAGSNDELWPRKWWMKSLSMLPKWGDYNISTTSSRSLVWGSMCRSISITFASLGNNGFEVGD